MSDFLLKSNFKEHAVNGALNRLGVIDIGSNSLRLVVFDGAARSPAYFYNEKVICSLASGLSADNRLNVLNQDRALAAIKRFVLLADSMGSSLVAIATAAIRNASNGIQFCEEIFEETGLNVTIITGEEEAKLSAQGVLLGWPDADGLVCDLGGASLEMAEITEGFVGKVISRSVGPLILNQLFGNEEEKRDFIKSELEITRGLLSKDYKNIYLVGGSWRSIARTQMEITNYPLKVLHEYQLKIPDIKKTIDWMQKVSLAKLKTISPSSNSRLRLLPTSAVILDELIENFQPKRLAVSSYGIREGLLYNAMGARLKKQDPLLAACLHMEDSAARIPGFGITLFNFIKPIFQENDEQFFRLMKAACLLHDVTWRAHPDYRAEVCFDNATRANLGGIDHRGRAFLALALLYRYKTPKKIDSFSRILSILDKKDQRRAEILGKAMRFGAMLSGSTAKSMGELKLDNKEKLLKLTIPKKYKDLFSEVVKQRFLSLASSLKYKTLIILV